jgi:phosphatidylserine/phosphatidylglycerophosphate/cardiolipin synthase-like enzyme
MGQMVYGKTKAILLFTLGFSLIFSSMSSSAATYPAVQLILHDPTVKTAPTDKCDSLGCKSLKSLIDSAKSSIDIAVYGTRKQTDLLESIKKAKARGVKVRVVMNKDSSGKNYYSDSMLWANSIGNVVYDYESELRLNEIENPFYKQPKCPRPKGFAGPLQCMAFDAGDRWIIAGHASVDNFVADDEENNTKDRIMHNKFFIIDNQIIWTGSANISDSDVGGYSANTMVIIRSKEVAAAYTKEFEQMYAGKFHAEKVKSDQKTYNVEGTPVKVLFSPRDFPMKKSVQKVIRQANTSIYASVFYLTNKYVAADLIKAKQRGVDVRIIVDATSAENGYSKHEILREVGIPVKVENWGGKMHSKSMVADGKYIVAGSMNWTTAGDSVNDENTLVIESTTLGKQYEQYFNKIWKSVPDKWLKQRPAPESLDSKNSCFDGSDNDFDSKVDQKGTMKFQPDDGCFGKAKLTPLPGHKVVLKSKSPQPPTGYRLVE